MSKNRILEIKQDIDEAKTELAKLEGKKEGQVSQLKEDWDCTTVKKAEKKLVQMKKDKDRLSDEITKELQKLENAYYQEEAV